MYFLYILTLITLLVSFFADRKKTIKALKIAFKKMVNILPAFFVMLILVSFILYLIPNEMILFYLGSENKWLGLLSASCFGSLTLMPGFIAFPLSGILLKKGVSYMVLSAFTTTLMMVGVMTFPVERAYFGSKVTLIRNVLSFMIAMIVAFFMGIFFGEIF